MKKIDRRSTGRSRTAPRPHFRKKFWFQLLDPLEYRQLLAVDLTPAFEPFAQPSIGIGGKEQVVVDVTNLGTTNASGGPLQIDVYAELASDGGFNQNTATLLTHFSKPLSIAHGVTQPVTVLTSISSDLPVGNYIIYAAVDPNNLIIESNDSNNFAASGVLSITPLDVDLTASFGNGGTIPSTVITGSNPASSVPIIITNIGTDTIPAGTTISAEVVARPTTAVDDSQDIVINKSPITFNVSSMGQNGTRKATVALAYPVNMLPGNYLIVVKADTDNDLVETNENNNEAIRANTTLTIVQGFTDISAGIVSDNLPPATLVGTAKNGSVVVSVTNLGNLAAPSPEHVNVAVVLHLVNAGADTSGDVPLGSMNNQSIANMAANGGHKNISVPVTVPILAPTGVYEIVATITPVELLAGDLLPNNTATGNPLTVGPRFTDLDIPTFSDSFPAFAVSGAPGNVQMTMENLGNVPAVGSVTIKVLASPDGNINDALPVVGSKTLNVNLASGATSAKQTVAVTLPTSLQTVTYTLFVQVNPTGFVDSNLLNNVEQMPTTVVTAPASVDLDFQTATQPFGANALGGATGQATFKIQNNGNIPDNAQFTITYYASPTDVVTPGQIPVGAVVIGTRTFSANLAPGAISALQTTTLTLPTPLADTSYVILAKVSASGLNDSNPLNNITVPNLGTVLVSHFTSVFPAADGDTLTFTKTSSQTVGGVTNQRGNFVTNNGIKGTYLIADGGPVDIFLTLNFNNSPATYSAKLNFDANPFLFGGDTIDFSFDSTGSLGSAPFTNMLKTVFFSLVA